MYLEEKIKIFKKENVLVSHKKINDNIYFYANFVFDFPQFIELQKNLFNEFLVEIISYLEKENLDIEEFKQWFENKLQSFNTKLNLFVDKLNIDKKIKIRWSLQVVIDSIYINTMIWEVSTLVFRNNKLNYLVENDIFDDFDIDESYVGPDIEIIYD